MMKNRFLLCLMALTLCFGSAAFAEDGIIAPCEKETEVSLSLPQELAYIRDVVPLPNGTFLVSYSELTDEDAAWEKQYSDFLACFDMDGNLLWHETLRVQEEAYEESFIPYPDHVLQYVADEQELPNGYTRKIGFDGTFGESKTYKVREQEAKVTPISAYPYYIERYSSGDMHDAPECTVYNTLTGAKKHMRIMSTATDFFPMEDGLAVIDTDYETTRFRLFDTSLTETLSISLPDYIPENITPDTIAESKDSVYMLYSEPIEHVENGNSKMLYNYTLVAYQKESGAFQDSAIRFAFTESWTYLIDEIFVPCDEGFIVAMKSRSKAATAWLCLLTKEGILVQLDALGIGIDAYWVGRDENTITILTKDSSKALALHRYTLSQQ